MMNQLYTLLPDDRPITAICIVENVDKCPKGFCVVSKTHDQDSDADLWRESNFFGRRCTRYLCLSKTEGSADRVVESIMIIGEKETPPEGFSVCANTWDTGQKAWRKKRLCYKSGHAASTMSAVTDIIVLSRTKKPPEEFTYCGEVNGMTLCHKIGRRSQPTLVIPYSLKPMSPISPGPDYVNAGVGLNQGQILRKAPPPPPPQSNYSTISGFKGLEGVPFILNPAFTFLDQNRSSSVVLPSRPKTAEQIEKEFSYNFRTERET